MTIYKKWSAVRFSIPLIASCYHAINLSAFLLSLLTHYLLPSSIHLSHHCFSPSYCTVPTFRPHISPSLPCSVFPLICNTQSDLYNSILLPWSTPFLSSLLRSSWQAAIARSALQHSCLPLLLYSHHHLLTLFPVPSIFFLSLFIRHKELQWMKFNEG